MGLHSTVSSYIKRLEDKEAYSWSNPATSITCRIHPDQRAQMPIFGLKGLVVPDERVWRPILDPIKRLEAYFGMG